MMSYRALVFDYIAKYFHEIPSTHESIHDIRMMVVEEGCSETGKRMQGKFDVPLCAVFLRLARACLLPSPLSPLSPPLSPSLPSVRMNLPPCLKISFLFFSLLLLQLTLTAGSIVDRQGARDNW